MIDELVHIHAEFALYEVKMFAVDPCDNIASRISSLPDLKYLHQFYLDYRRLYEDKMMSRQNRQPTLDVTNVSRSTDLPFLGESVLRTGKAKYLFVFEGSLSARDCLSITVLSCFWPITNIEPYQNLFRTFWPRGQHAYEYIVQCLGITPKIARQSYVVDAVRIGAPDQKSNLRQNRQLLLREIELLNPEIVILVGGTAARTIGLKAQDKRREWIKLQFPKKYKSKENIRKANRQYSQLHKLWPA